MHSGTWINSHGILTSWRLLICRGSTRVAEGEGGKTVIISDEGRFDPRSIPKQKWDDYAAEKANRSQEDARSEISAGTARQSVRTSMFVPTVDQRGRFSRLMDQQNFFDNPPRLPGSDSRTPGRSPLRQESALGDSQGNLPARLGDVLVMQETSILPSNRLSRPAPSILDPRMSYAGTIPGLPSDDQLLEEIKKMLESADLMTVTKRDVKLHLEKVFGVPLDVRREYINQCTEAVLSGKL
jgi:chitin synthase